MFESLDEDLKKDVDVLADIRKKHNMPPLANGRIGSGSSIVIALVGVDEIVIGNIG